MIARSFLLLLALAACTAPPEPPNLLQQDTYVRLCVAWDMAYGFRLPLLI